MYYIIYFLKSQNFRENFEVIPENWIRGIETQREKFLNNGLNRNQVQLCYWTNSTAARNSNGAIRLDFAPDFEARFDNQFPSDGCYLCKLVKAKGNILLDILFYSRFCF